MESGVEVHQCAIMSDSTQAPRGKAPRLTEATVQEIQLELIRRHKYNNFYGEEVATDLMAHRAWWEAVLIDVLVLAGWHGISWGSLIKLRDLPYNYWHVDTLCILAIDEDSARRLAELGEKWLADSVTVHDEEDTDRALGGGPDGRRLVTMWWD